MSNSRLALIFCVSVLTISWGFELFIIAYGGVTRFGPSGLVTLMCIPGVLAIALRWGLRAGFDDAGFRLGPVRFYGYALAIPAASAALLAVASIRLDIREFAPVSRQALNDATPVLLSIASFGFLGAVGEELGWRGFLLPKLIGSVRHPYAVTALVWAAWHVPLIAFGDFYRTEQRFSTASIYTLGILAMSFVLSELRMRSGSVWPPAVLHWAHNITFQFVMPALILTSPGSRSQLWHTVIGDTGIAIALLYAFAYVLMRGAPIVERGQAR